jgi:hypothetical protein
LTSAGSVSAPSYSFSADTNTGIYTSAADTINFATNATNRLSINNASLTSTLPILAPDGTSSNPSISFQGTENTGIWRHTASGQICFSVAGTIPLVLNTTFVIPYVDLGASLGLSNYRWTVVYAQNGTIQTSDVNLKTNVEPTPLGLDFINRLNPIRYKWAEVKDQDGKTIQSAGTRYHYGLIAQEVKTVLDDIKITTQDAAFFTDSSITEDSTKPARYGLNYTELICPIIKSIKELKAADISYSADIVTLKANINTCLQNIESRLSRIESLALINLNHLPAVGSV